MIVGIGIDVVAVERIDDLLDRYGRRVRERLFTDAELAECEGRVDPGECFAARFAAKEATLKALRTGKSLGFRWTDIEIVRSRDGSPSVSLKGNALDRAQELKVVRAHVSLSHDAGVACAIVVLERDS